MCAHAFASTHSFAGAWPLQTESPRVAAFRKQLDKVIQDKHEDTMCKMGGIMAAGVLDAGGRNVTIGLRSRSGNHRMAAVIGMAVFTQYWCVSSWRGVATVSRTKELKQRFGAEEDKNQPIPFWKEPSRASFSSFQREPPAGSR